MEIHKYEKAWLAVSLVLIVFFISTVVYASATGAVDMVDDSGGTVEDSNVLQRGNFSDRGVERTGENEYTVHMVAVRFSFLPNTVRVPENSTVTFRITSGDVVHGYQIVGTNVNTMVVPGQVSEITVEFDEPREYGVICNEYCGSAHHEMQGKLVVVPREEWEGAAEGGEA